METKLREERKLFMPEWKQLCQNNFVKSLDHRSFFFREEHKKQLSVKKQIDELKRIISTKNKNTNQLKGGTQSCEFYSTYCSFNILNVQVFPDHVLSTPEIL
jgi:histone deacetylase complex regulatory component SIN3